MLFKNYIPATASDYSRNIIGGCDINDALALRIQSDEPLKDVLAINCRGSIWISPRATEIRCAYLEVFNRVSELLSGLLLVESIEQPLGGYTTTTPVKTFPIRWQVRAKSDTKRAPYNSSVGFFKSDAESLQAFLDEAKRLELISNGDVYLQPLKTIDGPLFYGAPDDRNSLPMELNIEDLKDNKPLGLGIRDIKLSEGLVVAFYAVKCLEIDQQNRIKFDADTMRKLAKTVDFAPILDRLNQNFLARETGKAPIEIVARSWRKLNKKQTERTIFAQEEYMSLRDKDLPIWPRNAKETWARCSSPMPDVI